MWIAELFIYIYTKKIFSHSFQRNGVCEQTIWVSIEFNLSIWKSKTNAILLCIWSIQSVPRQNTGNWKILCDNKWIFRDNVINKLLRRSTEWHRNRSQVRPDEKKIYRITRQHFSSFIHHMAMALEEFTGFIWHSRVLFVASLMNGQFIRKMTMRKRKSKRSIEIAKLWNLITISYTHTDRHERQYTECLD